MTLQIHIRCIRSVLLYNTVTALGLILVSTFWVKMHNLIVEKEVPATPCFLLFHIIFLWVIFLWACEFSFFLCLIFIWRLVYFLYAIGPTSTLVCIILCSFSISVRVIFCWFSFIVFLVFLLLFFYVSLVLFYV